eukprot:scaffold118259_cov66-Phaeocystis_antarctica.AAC.6
MPPQPLKLDSCDTVYKAMLRPQDMSAAAVECMATAAVYDASCSAVAVSPWPLATASMSAVVPSSFAAFTSRPGTVISAVTASVWPKPAASMSAVWPLPFSAFTSRPGAASSAVTASLWPKPAAIMTAVWPLPFSAFTSRSGAASNAVTVLV